jgi:hypothetical protein
MRKHSIVAFALLACAGALAQIGEKEPAWALKFTDFAVLESFHSKPAKPILTSRAQRTFRSAITRATAKGPNFAGHYTVAEWGCGSGCMSIAIVDAASGKVFPGPFKILSMPLAEGEGGHDYQGAVYQLKSRLFIADGCPEEAKCGTYYYEWNQDKFKQLRFDPAPAK